MPNKNGLPTETEIQTEIRQILELHGWYVIRHQQGLGSLKGLSDLSAIKDGQTVYIEVKTPRGRLSEWQNKFAANIAAHGGTYIVMRSGDDALQFCREWRG